MRTITLQRRVISWALVFLCSVLLGAGHMILAQNSELVLDEVFVDIDGARAIGLSPDGRLLAVVDSGRQLLCVYEIESVIEQSCGNTSPLRSGLRFQDVSWSPDSTRLVLAERSFMTGMDGDIWVMDAEAGVLTPLTDDGYDGFIVSSADGGGETFSVDVAPAWTPDGESITYSRSQWIDGAFTGNDIAIVPATGGAAESLFMVSESEPGVVFFGTEWQPDGSALFYTVFSSALDDPENGVYRYDVAAGSSEQVAGWTPELGGPALLQASANGEGLLVWYPQMAGRFSGLEPMYWLVDLASGETKPLLPPGGSDQELGWVQTVGFSPDGAWVMMATRNTDPDFQLWITDVSSGEEFLLVESLPGALVIDFGMATSWTDSGHAFIPSGDGTGTLLSIADL